LAERSVLDRRAFLKGVLAAGATVTVASCAPLATTTAPTPAAPSGPATVVGPSWIHPSSLVRPQPGYGGAHLTWKFGDTVKWLPPDKFPADAAADTLAKLPKTKLTNMYYLMQLGRIWERKTKDIQLGGGGATDTTFGFHHGSGEEGEYVGMCAALKNPPETPLDWLGTNMRHHGAYLAKGVDVNAMCATIWGKTTGLTRGYASYRCCDFNCGLSGALPLIGLAWQQSPGLAWSFKVRKTQQVAVSLTGDGSCSSRYAASAVRTSVNYKLPVVFVISNNFQQIACPSASICPSPYLADYFVGMGLPTTVVDGNNVGQVYSAMKDAVDRARAGNGPSIIECLTWRWYDHSGLAGAKVGVDAAWGLPYRTDDEVRAWLSRDAIVRFGNFLVDRGLFTQAELDSQTTLASTAVDNSIAFARAGPLPNGPDGAKGMWPGFVAPANQFFEHVVRTT